MVSPGRGHSTPVTDAPAPTHVLSRPDDRTVALDVVGPDDAPVVVLLHPSPGSRRFDPDPEVTASAGVCLVTLDRPGYGASSPWPEGTVPTVAGCADDVAAALDHLDVAEAAVVGWSAGGRVAAGVAARHPDRVRALAVVGTPSPADDSWIPPEHQAMLDRLRADPPSATAALTGVLAQVLGDDPEVALESNTGDADRALLGHPDVRARVLAMQVEALRQGPVGIASDIVSDQIADWGYDPTSVGAPAHVFSSEGDVITPDHLRWWAETMVDTTEHTTSGIGHLLVVTQWAEVLAAVGRPAR